MSDLSIQMIDNSSIQGREDKYQTITIDSDKALKSWQLSLFSFEWLNKDGSIKDREILAEREQEKYDIIKKKINNNEALERPILGLGLHDNIEIGSKREVFLVLTKQGMASISVHVPKSLGKEFKDYET